jgi:hypothetical protein
VDVSIRTPAGRICKVPNSFSTRGIVEHMARGHLPWRVWIAAALMMALPALAGAASIDQARPENHCDSIAAKSFPQKLLFWQQLLGLENWNISILLSHRSDLKPSTLGNIHWDADKRSATIRVLDAEDYQMACPDALADMEFTIVHELVHLELSSLPRSEASRREEEFAVNQLTEALLKLERRK